jgi:hypothetical protein
MALGYVHVSLTLGNQTASAPGFFTNIGYEWRWDSGLGIILGGGLAHVGSVTVIDTTGGVGVTKEGGWVPNLEFGLRFMFI